MTLIEAGASWMRCSKPLAVTTTVSIVVVAVFALCAQTAAGPMPKPAVHKAATNCLRVATMRRPATRSFLLMIPISPVPGLRRTPRAASCLPFIYE
ncbi:hypothetical protein D3C86_1059020 [compost metagenome]